MIDFGGDVVGIDKVLKRSRVLGRDQAMSAFFAARAAFDAFARMDAPHLPDDPHEALQVRLVRWQTRNFGLPRPCEIACGIAEEVGELSLGVDLVDADEVYDAIGDVMVYGTQLASAQRLSIARVIKNVNGSSQLGSSQLGSSQLAFGESHSTARHLSQSCGYLAHVQLKAEQGIRQGRNPDLVRLGTFLGLVSLFGGLTRIGNINDQSIVPIWIDVSHRVLKRDWTVDKVTAGGEVST